MTIAAELQRGADLLREHLLRQSRRTIIEPLSSQLKSAVQARFRAQLQDIKDSGILHVLPTSHPLTGLADIARQAYDAGAQIVSGMLGTSVVTEAESDDPHLPALFLAGLTGTEDLVDQIDATSQSAIAKIVSDGRGEGLTNEEVLAGIEAQFADWQGQRSQTIADTAVSTAYHQGGADMAEAVADTGVDVEKAWSVQPGACPVCEGNAADGWIPEDIMFASGDSEPPQHPNCMCSVDYRTN